MSLIISISLFLFDEIILSCLLAVFNIFSFLANRSIALKKQRLAVTEVFQSRADALKSPNSFAKENGLGNWFCLNHSLRPL